MSGHGGARAAAADAAARAQQRQLFWGMTAHDRHRKMVHDLVTYYGARPPDGGPAAPAMTDLDILRESFRFIRSEGDDAGDSWEVRLAKRYYSKLFKEYAIADLSRYKEGKVGLRWRTQKEVVSGRGQFVCGAKGCEERRGLASFEVPFAYQEAGERKQALVKVRLCPTHAYQLNYRKHKEAEAAHRRRERRAARKAARRDRRRSKEVSRKKKKRRRSGSSQSASSSSSNSGSPSSGDEREEQRSGGSKRLRGGGDGAGREGAGTGGAGPAPAEDDFDAFLKSLFE